MAFALLQRICRTVGRAFACGLVGSMLVASAAGAITIEIDDVAPDRVERQRAFVEGALPLAGTPDLGQFGDRLAAKGLKPGAHMLIRVFKAESELEVWMQNGAQYVLFATYPICHWAGTIGPKIKEGDKQNPEGFYSVGPRQLHRIGRWPRSLNIGFPNTYDRAWGRTGSYILVHGGCSSVGCFAMTNAVMAEIFSLTEQALRAGQHRVDVHVFPFRMTEANLKTHAKSPWLDFWRNLKEGYDAFEQTRLPPRVGLCDRRYVIEPQRPGEVGGDGPLALCGALRAALIEPSFQSHVEPPPDRRQAKASLSSQPESPTGELSQEARTAYSGKALPALASLEEQMLLLPPRVSRPPRAGRPGRPIAGLPVPPPCNVGLASCRKYLALKATTDAKRQVAGQARITRQTSQEVARVVARLSTVQQGAIQPSPARRAKAR